MELKSGDQPTVSAFTMWECFPELSRAFITFERDTVETQGDMPL